MILSSQLVENHIHIWLIALFHFETCWEAPQSFCELKQLFGFGTTGKAKLEGGLTCSNLAVQVSQIWKVEAAIRAIEQCLRRVG